MIGSQVREYVFRKLLGTGGMGEVWLVEHAHLNQRRAIKLLHREMTRQPGVVQRFVNEARAVAKLVGRDHKPHRNLIQVYELFQENETWFMVMEYLEGETLARVIDSSRGPMPLDRVVHAIGGVANALKIAHANGIVHRDLKPDNVFVTRRESDPFHIVLLDFGVAQLRNDLVVGPHTKAGVLIGTPHFMAPEQLAGRAVTAATDVFGLGLLAYQMATGGMHPWQYESHGAFYVLKEAELYGRMMYERPVDPRRHAPHLSDEQVSVILAALAREPSQRSKSAAAFAIALAERAPTDGVRADGLAILRERYPELFDVEDMGETMRSLRPPASMPATSDLDARYEFGRKLGEGGMADVYLATTRGVEGFARQVAIKRVLRELSAQNEFAKLFVREAQIAARLSHPNIIAVLDFARDLEGRLFLVMEYVDGYDLAALLDGGPLTPSLAIYLAAEILRGLGYAHDLIDPAGSMHGVVHRDISPQNVLLSYEGAVKVCDFGLARALSVSSTSSNGPVGKPAYLSPEQTMGASDLDGRADLFAVGVMLWEMLAGKRLFSGTLEETLAQVHHKEIELPSKLRRDVPAAVDPIVLKLLERDRTARYQRADEAIRDLLGCGVASTDGRGELVAVMAKRRSRSSARRGPFSTASPMIALAPTISKPPSTAPKTTTTLDAATGESRDRAGSTTRSRKPILVAAAIVATIVVVAIATARMQRSSGSHLATTGDDRNIDASRPDAVQPNPLGTARDDGNIDARPDASLPAAQPNVDAMPTSPLDVTRGAPTDAAIDASIVSDAGAVRAVADAGPSAAAPRIPVRGEGARVIVQPHEQGDLSVQCDPWCEVWIDGVKVGTAPKIFKVTVGAHRVRLFNPDLKRETTEKVTISTTEPAVLSKAW